MKHLNKSGRKFLLLGVFAFFLLAGAGCYGSKTTTNTNSATNSNAAQTGSSVAIQNMAFSPSSLTVSAGTTVTWTNNDSVSHTVTGDAGGPGSSTLSPGQTYQFTFTTAGTFPYHCSIHPSMTGTVIVTQ